jgi:hypothetical protein
MAFPCRFCISIGTVPLNGRCMEVLQQVLGR